MIRSLIRISFMLLLLALIVAAFVFAISFIGRFSGDRIYIHNGTNCQIVAMDEHEGITAAPNETIMIKSGHGSRTPTMLIASGGSLLFGGLHFTDGGIETRGQGVISVPLSWRKTSLMGSTLTYELTANGALIIQPSSRPLAAASQPTGFPLRPIKGFDMQQCKYVQS